MSKKKNIIKLFLAIFCCFTGSTLIYAESCSSTGKIEYKYTASGCSYTTQTRTCCSNGSWSEWNGECSACSSNECWDGKTCKAKDLPYYLEVPGAVKNSVSCMYPIKCVEGTGWVKASSTPGGCTCKAGYVSKGATICEKDGPKLVSEDLYVDIRKSSLPSGASCTSLCDAEFERMVTNCSGAARCEFSHTEKMCSEAGHPTYGYVKRNGYITYCQTLESSSGPYNTSLNCRLFYTRTYCN